MSYWMTLVTEDTELNSRLDVFTALELLGFYFDTYEGFRGLGVVHEYTQDPDGDRPLIDMTVDALHSTFIDLQVLATAVDTGEEVVRATKLPGLDDETFLKMQDARAGNIYSLLIEFYWRIHDGWEELAPSVREQVVGQLRMVRTSEDKTTPEWEDLLAILNEIESLNDECMGDGDVVIGGAEDLVSRYENAGSRQERLSIGS